MPELPEVQTIVDSLRPRLSGRRFEVPLHLRRDIVRPRGFDLAGAMAHRTIIGIERRAKRIVFQLDRNERFYIHLGMSGRLTVEPAEAPLLPHTHLVAAIADTGEQLRFRDPRRFGGIFWLGTAPDEDGTLGPEPLTLRPRQLADRLAKTTRAIKNALLDQRLVAGLGNIYVDEALHAAGIHPLAPANQLTPAQIATLNRAIKTTLRRAIRHRGSTLRDYVDAQGQKGGFQRLHKVYAREGDPCHRCRTLIDRIIIGGRSTHFCPACQRLASPALNNQSR